MVTSVDVSTVLEVMKLKTHKYWIHTIALLAVIGISGCAATGPLVEVPLVQLRGVEASELSFKGQTFLLKFEVSNPNPFPLRIRSVRYRIELENQRFAGGEAPCDISIPAGGNGEFAISVKLNILKSASRLTAILRGGMGEPVAYELDGRLTIGIPLVKPLLFSTSGVITIASN